MSHHPNTPELPYSTLFRSCGCLCQWGRRKRIGDSSRNHLDPGSGGSKGFDRDGAVTVFRHVCNRKQPASYSHLEWRIEIDRKSTRLNSSHVSISYAVFCLI